MHMHIAHMRKTYYYRLAYIEIEKKSRKSHFYGELLLAIEYKYRKMLQFDKTNIFLSFI